MTDLPDAGPTRTEVPASSLDVAKAISALIQVVAPTVVVGAVRGPAKEIHEAESRLAVTLESFLGEEQSFLAAEVVAGLAKPLMERLAVSHQDLHLHMKSEG